MSYPYFRFFSGDYLRDTRDLSLLQHGAYLMLMLHCYSSGKPELPHADLDACCRIAGAKGRHERAAVAYVVERFWVRGRTDLGTHQRIAKELSTATLLSKQQSDKAQKRWSHGNATAMPLHMQRQCQPDVLPDLLNPRVTETQTPEILEPKPHFENKGNGKTAYPRDSIWDRDDGLTDAKGRELGIPARPGELYPEYRMRLHAAIAERRRK